MLDRRIYFCESIVVLIRWWWLWVTVRFLGKLSVKVVLVLMDLVDLSMGFYGFDSGGGLVGDVYLVRFFFVCSVRGFEGNFSVFLLGGSESSFGF